MSDILTAIDEQSSLSHYRIKGSKNGVRQYQYEDGSLTPLGRIHYGVGKPREKAKEPEKSERQLTKEQKAKIENAIKKFKENRRAKVEARKKAAEEDKKKREDEQKTISKLSDDDLNKKLARLQKEKQVSELLNERANREKGPLRAAASKLLKEAAENFARKALNEVVDQVITKAKNKAKDSFKLSDYKDVDPYSLSTDKLKAVSEAFNNAANLVRNKYAVEHEGRSPGGDNNNNQNNNQNQGQNNNNQNKQQNQSNNQPKKQDKKDEKKNEKKQSDQNNKQPEQKQDNGKKLSKQQSKAKAMAQSGKTYAEIAKALGVSESTVLNYLEDLVQHR